MNTNVPPSRRPVEALLDAVVSSTSPSPGLGVPPTGALIGTRPRPRVLIVRDGLPSGVVNEVKRLASTVDEVSDLGEVRHAEWDAIVTALNPLATRVASHWALRPSPHLHVLAFISPTGSLDAIDTGSSYTDGSLGWWKVNSKCGRQCGEFAAPAHDDNTLNDLVRNHLIEPARRRDGEYWWFDVTGPVQWNTLAADGDGHALAGAYRRTDLHGQPRGHAVLFPNDVTHPADWVRWTFRHWQGLGIDAFSELGDWTDDPMWSTATEAALRAERNTVDEERRAAAAVAEARLADLDRKLADATEAARIGPRRLLTEQGEELVGAVVHALTALGFEVEVIDVDPARKGKLLEDLRVTDPDEDGWIALAEVRGYERGAQVGDLARIERFTTHFVEETGRRPTRRWYIVNQHRNEPPNGRPEPLHSNPVDTHEFASNDGAVFDSRSLFRFSETENADLGRLRAQLRAASGCWPLPQ